jgi:hypothetical protein
MEDIFDNALILFEINTISYTLLNSLIIVNLVTFAYNKTRETIICPTTLHFSSTLFSRMPRTVSFRKKLSAINHRIS